MLKTVKDACVLNPSAIAFQMADHIENLQDVIDDAEDGSEFFAQTYITHGMDQLFRQGLKRLAGKSDDGVFQLTQAMGGGKTHLLIALGLLAKNPALREKVVPELARDAAFDAAKVVAFTGRNYPAHFFWGEIAAQLGKREAFSQYWAHGAQAPDEKAWIELIGNEPVLILLDEMPPYFDYAITIRVGDGNLANVATAALANLLSASLKLPRLCVVLSNLSGSYEAASKHLGKALRDVVAETNRQARPITPVQLGGSEIYQILRKRLFKQLPENQVIDRIADAYANAISEAEKAKSIGKSSEQIAAEIHASYPFHPGLKDVIAMFKENESFRQTRGLMRFVSRILKSVWERPENDVFLIGAQHLDLNDSEVRDEVLAICNLQSAMAKDIADRGNAHAELIDAKQSNDAGSQVARLLMTASLAKTLDGIRGLDKQRLLEYLIAPHRDPLEFADAFEELRKSAWYLHPGEREAYYFSDQENLTKRLEKEAETAPENKIEEEMRRRLLDMFEPKVKIAYEHAFALPRLDEINLKNGRVLLILSPDNKIPPQEAKRLFESVTEKNNFCIVAGDGSDLASLENSVRRLYAVAKVDKQLPANHPQKEELQHKTEDAEQDFRSTAIASFNRLFFPMRDGLKTAKFSIVFHNNAWEGERQVERSLTDTAASKLVTDVKAESDKLINRAEDQLWPQGQHRIRWVDVIDRSKTNARWLWLPPKGLEELRRIATAEGRWLYTEDGYIDKNPAKAKTSVVVSETHYEEDTGKAHLKVSAHNAGPRPVIYYSESPDVSPASSELKELNFVAEQTRLYFLAVDPTQSHETGDPEVWRNKLFITHQPHTQGTTRVVELKVSPRGELRYSLDGTNPREGQIYHEPFEISRDETLIRVFASDAGVEATREFRVPKAGQTAPAIDPAQPAQITKSQKQTLEFLGSADAYKLLKQAKRFNACLKGLRLQVGQGDRNANLRFGSGFELTSDSLENLLASLLAAFGKEQPQVEISLSALSFANGQDMLDFSAALNIELNLANAANIEASHFSPGSSQTGSPAHSERQAEEEAIA